MQLNQKLQEGRLVLHEDGEPNIREENRSLLGSALSLVAPSWLSLSILKRVQVKVCAGLSLLWLYLSPQKSEMAFHPLKLD